MAASKFQLALMSQVLRIVLIKFLNAPKKNLTGFADFFKSHQCSHEWVSKATSNSMNRVPKCWYGQL
jgi:hypothetical protein